MPDGLVRHHLAHIRLSRGIAYLARAAADEYDGAVSRLLHDAHRHQLHEVTHMQAVRGGVETYIKGHALFAQKLIKLVFIDRLLDVSSLFKRIEYVFHLINSLK